MFNRFAPFIMGIGPFKPFKTFHRFAPFKTFNLPHRHNQCPSPKVQGQIRKGKLPRFENSRNVEMSSTCQLQSDCEIA
jgi:hypothetical protein